MTGIPVSIIIICFREKSMGFKNLWKIVIWKEGLMEQNTAFEWCVDFLARMIEKYGQEFLDEINVETSEGEGTKTEDTKSV